MKGIDMHEISVKKKGSVQLVGKYRINHKKVLTHSQELDVLINKWMEKQQTQSLSIEYIVYHDSHTHKNKSKKGIYILYQQWRKRTESMSIHL